MSAERGETGSPAVYRKFEMFWRDTPGREPVREVYERRCSDVTAAARELVAHFNGTLRPGEKRRTLVSAKELSAPLTEHVWVKMTAMTQRGRFGKAFDKMHCQRCGLTGKRYGLSPTVSIDPPFNRTPGFKNCARSAELLERHRKRQWEKDNAPPAKRGSR